MSSQNKANFYGLLFKAAAEALTTIGADRMHLDAHWRHCGIAHLGSESTAPSNTFIALFRAAGISPDGERWVANRPRFFLPVRVLSRSSADYSSKV
jgi:hypothetical protein